MQLIERTQASSMDELQVVTGMDVKSDKPKRTQRRHPRPTADERATAERQNLRSDLGKRLREARESKEIGLRELARRLGVSASLISQIETGKTEPSINTLFAIVSELELSVNEIVFEPSQDSDSSGSAS